MAHHVSCTGENTCAITYTVKEPTGVSDDDELILPTRQMWKAMFTDPRFQSGTITVSGPATSVGGKSSTGVYYSLSCDQQAAQQIDWDKVDGNGLRTLCAYEPRIKGMPGMPGS